MQEIFLSCCSLKTGTLFGMRVLKMPALENKLSSFTRYMYTALNLNESLKTSPRTHVAESTTRRGMGKST